MIFFRKPVSIFRDHALVARLRIYEFRVLVNPLTIGRSRHQMGFVERARGLGSPAGWWADVPAEQARLAKPTSQACKANKPGLQSQSAKRSAGRRYTQAEHQRCRGGTMKRVVTTLCMTMLGAAMMLGVSVAAGSA